MDKSIKVLVKVVIQGFAGKDDIFCVPGIEGI